MRPLDGTPAGLPQRIELTGARVRLVPVDAAVHAEPLFAAMAGHPELWRYMFDAPPASLTDFRENLAAKALSRDPLFYAIVEKGTEQPLGVASYLRIEPVHRVIEVGNILYSPQLQRTPAATEAMYLMARYAFDGLGFRRYEWKCNALNAPSRAAAQRLGFTFEGIFRQHMIIKGENRDTAWFAMLDTEWPARRAAMERWLAADNFDSKQQQIRSLGSMQSEVEGVGR